MKRLGKFDWLVMGVGSLLFALCLFLVTELAIITVVFLYMMGWI